MERTTFEAANPRVATLPADGGDTAGAYGPTSVLVEPAEDLVGRRAELLALEGLVGAGARLVTITGSAGMGKTRLALEWARRRDDRVIIVDLSAARSLDEAAAGIARAFGAALARDASARDVLRRIAAESGAPLVLVLDNVEQLAACARDLLEPFLDAKTTQTLVTSREVLRLRDERVLDVAPLSIAETVELFVRRASAARRGFSLDEDERGVVEAIGARLEGVPLAIELCAALADVLAPAQILPRLERKLDLLASGARDAPRRHATLRAALEWSWELLDERERIALAQCAVFRQSFSLEAAEAVLDAGASALAVLRSLHAKSLVRVVEARRIRGERRFRLLESVRELAAEALATSARHADAIARHEAFFLGVDPREVARVDEEAIEIHEVAERALDPLCVDAVRARTALRALLVLEPVYLACARGRLDVFADALDRALAAAGDEADALVAHARNTRAFADVLRGRHACVIGFRRALEEARRAGSDREEARALMKVAMLLEHGGHVDDARAAFEQARELAAKIGDPDLVAEYEATLGAALTWRGDAAGARVHFERAVARFEERGDRDLATLAAGGLALAELNLERVEEAEAHVRRALEDHDPTDHRRIRGYALGALGRVLQARGDLDGARAAFEDALAVHRAVADRWQEGVHLGLLGYLELEARDLGAARRALTRSVELLLPAYDRQSNALSLAALGAVDCLEGRSADARERFDAATRALASIDNVGARLAVAIFAALAGNEDDARRVIALAESPSADGGPPPVRGSELHRLALRVLRQGRANDPAPTSDERASDPVVVVVGADARWLRVGRGEPVRLAKARAVRLVLLRLVRARLDAPGSSVSLDELFVAGWPGERIARRHAANRVYVTLHKLKSLGLKGVVVHRDDGFLLDPSAVVLEALDTAAELARVAV